MAQLAAARPDLELALDREAELPVGAQLAWKLRGLIASGRLAPRERLPSVRALADRVDVNVNTVRAVYRRLEEEGLIVSRHGAGTFVSDGDAGAAAIETIVEDALREAREAGVDPAKLASAIYAAAPSPQGDPLAVGAATRGGRRGRSASSTTLPGTAAPEEDRLRARRELRRQIARLEAELAGYADTRAARSAAPRRLGNVPRVADIPELERTRDRLLDQLREARAEVERKGRREARARRRVEDMVREPERHKWEWVSGEETGERGCKEFRVVPRFGPVGAAMGWWRVKVSGGCPLAARLAAAAGEVRRRGGYEVRRRGVKW
jgi:DNA-binding transcriptional regulator YhcF (GntR family)